MENTIPRYNPPLGLAARRVPEDVLENIFLLGDKPSIPVSSWVPYSPLGVCRKWRSVAISIPELWTTVKFTVVDTAPDIDDFLAQLSWSKRRPLDITLFLYPVNKVFSAGDWMVFNALALQVPRWRSLKAFYFYDEVLDHILHVVPLAKRLETLAIVSDFPPAWRSGASEGR